MSDDTPPTEDPAYLAQAVESWATVAFALARDLERLVVVCMQEHPPKMGSPTKDWEAGTQTRHSDGQRCVLLSDGRNCMLPNPDPKVDPT